MLLPSSCRNQNRIRRRILRTLGLGGCKGLGKAPFVKLTEKLYETGVTVCKESMNKYIIHAGSVVRRGIFNQQSTIQGEREERNG